jgi:hypothetical protein
LRGWTGTTTEWLTSSSVSTRRPIPDGASITVLTYGPAIARITSASLPVRAHSSIAITSSADAAPRLAIAIAPSRVATTTSSTLASLRSRSTRPRLVRLRRLAAAARLPWGSASSTSVRSPKRLRL